ncbi:hypothetical protein ARAM_005178, partial [Aspergillus rambellii]
SNVDGGCYRLLTPPAILIIFIAGTLINRRRSIRLPETPSVESPLLADDPDAKPTEDEYSADTVDNSRTVQSRILARFPFLLEIWYWLLTYWIYQGARAVSARWISGNQAIFDGAERHARQVLRVEALFHFNIELSVQQFVLGTAPWLMALLARVYYSHITVGVLFLVYCYTFCKRSKYQEIRRTLALENVIAFTLLTLWRCMPPRLLPGEYGFLDVLHSNRGGSAWTQNKFQLTIAAMPSLHFGNSLFVALCLVHFSPHWYVRMVAPVWPTLMGVTIVATANHFILDAVAGACVVLAAYQFNSLMLGLLPVERRVFRGLGLEKR